MNNAECLYDLGDCPSGPTTNSTNSTTTPEENIPSGCVIPPETPTDYLGDGYCDPILNTEECQYDLGDCENQVTSFTMTGAPSTTSPGPEDTTTATTPEPNIPPGCLIPPDIPTDYLGDGLCNSILNTEECENDLGDCAPITTPSGPYVPEGCIIPEGVPAFWLGKLRIYTCVQHKSTIDYLAIAPQMCYVTTMLLVYQIQKAHTYI